MQQMTCIQDAKAANERINHHWFTPGALRFFNSKIQGSTFEPLKDGGGLFVSSECQEPGRTLRMWSVRRAMPDGQIKTVGSFMEHETLHKAIQALEAERTRLDTLPIGNE